MSRIKTLDNVRGALMLYIVLIIHGIFWLKILPLRLGALFLFEMPAIFIVSGFAYYRFEKSKFSDNKLDFKRYMVFVVSRYTRILAPYYVYVIVCIAIIFCLSELGYGVKYDLQNLIISWFNPLSFGTNYSISMLNWHLWFVPIFLIVTALMPLATKFKPIKNPNFYYLIFAILIAEYFFSSLNFWGQSITKQVLFYLIFSLFGYYLAKNKGYFKAVNFGLISVLSALLLILIFAKSGNYLVMDMQKNKFPPNYIFFVFSCFWVSLLLYVSERFPQSIVFLNKNTENVWLAPFVKYGYSIYLWQGLGYSIAVKAGGVIKLPLFFVWLTAIALSVALGVFFSSVEKFKFKGLKV